MHVRPMKCFEFHFKESTLIILSAFMHCFQQIVIHCLLHAQVLVTYCHDHDPMVVAFTL